MRTQEALDLDDLAFEEAPDVTTAMILPGLRRYVEDEQPDDDELGLRTLLANPEALSKAFRRELH